MIVILHCFLLGGFFSGVVFYLIGRAPHHEIEEYKKKGDPKKERFKEFKDSLNQMEGVANFSTPEERENARNRNQRFLDSLEPDAQKLFLMGLEKYQEQITKMKSKSEDELMDDYNRMQANEFRWLMFKIAFVLFILFMTGAYHYKSFNVKVIWIKFNQEFHKFSDLIIRPIVGHEHVDKIRKHSFAKTPAIGVSTN